MGALFACFFVGAASFLRVLMVLVIYFSSTPGQLCVSMAGQKKEVPLLQKWRTAKDVYAGPVFLRLHRKRKPEVLEAAQFKSRLNCSFAASLAGHSHQRIGVPAVTSPL